MRKLVERALRLLINTPEKKIFQDTVALATFWMPEIPENWESIFCYIEYIPQPEHGEDSLKSFLRNNLKHIKGIFSRNVFVEFIVNENGSLSDLKVLRGLNEEANMEAIRVLKLTSNWKPARRYGFPIKSKYIMPVKYE